jgi:hypothetical protein
MIRHHSKALLTFLIGIIGAIGAIVTTPPLAAQVGDCAAIAGADSLLAPNRALLLGEIHGTVESPRFVGELACHAVAAGLAVTVALELPQRDQPLIDSYFAEDGDAAAQDTLYSAFWRKSYQDGRTSVAMAELAQRLRQLGTSGSVEVALIDRPEARQDRDAVMATKLAEVVSASPEGIVIALTGNMHSRTAPGAPWNAAYKPMGYLLAEMLPDLDLMALDVAHTGGTAWVCLSNQPCHEQELGGSGTRESSAATLFNSLDEHGFHGRYEVGAIHASPPATAVEE